MKMKFCIIFGSPRKQGNTAALLKVFTEELENKAAEAEIFDVYEKNISGCRACLGCQSDKNRAYCIVKDDMQPVIEAIAACDVLVVAAPIYCWGLPGPVKTAFDRLIYSFCKYYGDDPRGPSMFEGKKLALLTTCGYPPEKGADLYEESMKRIAKHCRLEYAGMLAERHRNLKEPFMNGEKEAHARAFAVSLLEK